MILMTWQWWQTRSAIALAATSSPNTFPQPPMPTLAVMIVERCSQRVEMSWKSRSAPPSPMSRYPSSSMTSSFECA